MFKDIELKINYHKEKIIQSFIKRGIYPNNSLIQTQLNNIEARLSIFKSPVIKAGDNFDTNEINKAINDIYDDLKILYELLYEITKVEYNKLSYYINTHLRELEQVSNMYLKRAELESYSTAIGKSILFKHNDFNIDKKNDKQIIDLGEVELEGASKIACIANINNVKPEDIVFEFTNGDSTIRCNAYEYNRDTLTIPGEKQTNEHIIELNKNQKVNSLLELPIAIANTEGSSFVTMAGKDKILYKNANENGDIIEEKPIAINALSFKGHSYIDFYTVGGRSISFRFNKKPIATNFNTNANKIENLDYIHHFFIECDGGFSFEFELDKGYVYAIKENTLINNDSFFYSGQVDVQDFMVIHTLPGDKAKYNAKIIATNSTINQEDIDSVMIKKIR